MKPTTVPHHTFSEVLSMTGRQQHTDGLYVIAEEEGGNTGDLSQYPFRSDHFIVVLVLEGTTVVKINFTDYHLHSGQVLLIPPHAIRQFPDLKPGDRYAGLVFTSDFMTQSGLNRKHADMLDFFSANTPPVIDLGSPDFDRLAGILKLLEQKYTAASAGSLDEQVVHHLFLAFLYELGSIFQRNNSGKRIQLTRKEDISMCFIKLLADSFREERSVLFYAKKLYVTPRYLTQTVKETTGQTAGEIIDEMVIMEAKALLNNVSLSIAQVAESLYFSDQFFFSKYFKRHTGLTPSEYRKSS